MLRKIPYSFKTFAIPTSISADKFAMLKQLYGNKKFKIIRYKIFELYPHHVIGLISLAYCLVAFFIAVIFFCFEQYSKLDVVNHFAKLTGSLFHLFSIIFLVLPASVLAIYLVVMTLILKLDQGQAVLDTWLDSIAAEKSLRKIIQANNDYESFTQNYNSFKKKYSNYVNELWNLH